MLTGRTPVDLTLRREQNLPLFFSDEADANATGLVPVVPLLSWSPGRQFESASRVPPFLLAAVPHIGRCHEPKSNMNTTIQKLIGKQVTVMLCTTFEQPLKGELVECDSEFLVVEHSKIGAVVIPLTAVSYVYAATGDNAKS